MIIRNNKKRIKIMKESERKNFLTTLIPWSGLIIILSTGLAYCLLYCFYYGESLFFGFSIKLFYFSFNNSVFEILFLTMFLIFIIFYGILGYHFLVVKGIDLGLFQSGIAITIFNYCVLILNYIFGHFDLFLIAIVAVFDVIVFGLFIYIRKKQSQKTIDGSRNFLKLLAEIFIRSYQNPIFNGVSSLLPVFIFLMVSSMALGRFVGEFQESFIVVNTTPECFVVFSDNEKMYCVPFDEKNHEFYSYMRVLYFKDDPNLQVSQRKIGFLHPKQNPTPPATTTTSPTMTPTATITLTPQPYLTP